VHCVGNIAYRKRTQQSGYSIYGVEGGAVDGNTTDRWCVITGTNTPGQWWYVDFGGLYAVYNVTVIQSLQVCREKH
jgi:hypothetical protein